MGRFLPIIVATFALTFILSTCWAADSDDTKPEPETVQVELGGFCRAGGAPVGPGGSWKVVEPNVKKECPPNSSCRKGACNCDDLADGSVTSLANDSDGKKTCRKIANQPCSADNECYPDVKCVEGKCKCDPTKPEVHCPDTKQDITILSR